eukprot:GFUD01118133.1.p1 GENE.GFUD01118133.1~~GFUD01118133.1.p1  ORF type:complete len:100 (+),score=8.51 GFUD01118133.1:175-474(+)
MSRFVSMKADMATYTRLQLPGTHELESPGTKYKYAITLSHSSQSVPVHGFEDQLHPVLYRALVLHIHAETEVNDGEDHDHQEKRIQNKKPCYNEVYNLL